MTTMIEKMARAIAEARWRRYPSWREHGDTASAFADRQWGLYVGEAVSALQALLEPSSGMLDKGVSVLSNTQPHEWVSPHRVWKAMIQAAIEEGV